MIHPKILNNGRQVRKSEQPPQIAVRVQCRDCGAAFVVLVRPGQKPYDPMCDACGGKAVERN